MNRAMEGMGGKIVRKRYRVYERPLAPTPVARSRGARTSPSSLTGTPDEPVDSAA